MPVPNVILELIERFERNIDAYRSQKYNEAQLRQEFANPFFEALGWDIYNKLGYAEAYKDVIHEAAIKIGGFTKAPDYCFRTGGVKKFFVETKKPAVNIKTDPESAYQLRRYAWSAKLPLSILTDFEEFAVYDCRIKPEKTDSPSVARTLYINYKEFANRWEEIVGIFGKEAVYKGSFDKYVESTKLKRGTAEVDTAFLKEIESWRDALARNIALRNPGLAQRELNYAVQATIDRIIFLRICEDRGVEDYGKLMALQNGVAVYRRLCHLFEYADQRYNSGLFHFHKEKGRPHPDELTLNLNIDDKPLKDIFKKLYYPDSPYEFSVLSADILGQVYEQFLGKVIRLTAGHQAKIEDKPEVKKAGGVYYTPTYIVDYIVKNTVGKLIGPSPVIARRDVRRPDEAISKRDRHAPSNGARDDKKAMTPKKVSKLRILDPACGSGSFLIGAYQYLLDWHLNYYIANNPEKWASGRNPTIYQAPSPLMEDTDNSASLFMRDTTNSPSPLMGEGRGEGKKNWKLTTAEKKRILLNNIYGVDIDPQAVEVTKLSLLLKVLEGENEQTITYQLQMFKERALPDLGNNIKCGNSLIGPDFYDNQQLSFLDEEERYRINVFDWETEFQEVFKGQRGQGGQKGQGEAATPHVTSVSRVTSVPPVTSPGFDAVIGNPPYVRQEMLGEFKDYFSRNYNIYHGMADLYSYFIERGVSLLRKDGLFGYIVSNKWMRANYGTALRKWMKEQAIEQIVDFGDLPVFQKATTYPCILIISKNSAGDTFNAAEVKTLKFLDLSEYVNENQFAIKRTSLSYEGWSLADDKTQRLLAKLRDAGVPLSDYVQGKIYYGIKTGLNEAFVIDEKTREKLISEDSKSAEIIKPFLAGRDIKRYQKPETDKYLIFTRRGINIKEYPAIEAYLSQFKERLIPKPKNWKGGKWKGRKPGSYQWYEIQDSIDYWKEFETDKILWPEIASSARFTIDSQNFFANNKAYIIPNGSKFLLAVLNSKLMRLFIHSNCTDLQGNSFNFSGIFIERTPIRTIDFSDPADKAKHGHMVSLVDRMLTLNKQLPSAKTTHQKQFLQREIDNTDRQIDKLVYELYELMSEEIRIVEFATELSSIRRSMEKRS